MDPPYLTDEEIAQICEPLIQPAAQIRCLRAMGLIVKIKPNGKPLVGRSHFAQVMAGTPLIPATAESTQQPDTLALIAKFERRGSNQKKQSSRAA
jgi:Domain of unknown function (DUF4224)